MPFKSSTFSFSACTNTYDFKNEIIATTRKHYNTTSTTTPVLTVVNTYVYDHKGRKKQTYEQINGGTNVLLADDEYNEVGQLMTKNLHSTNSGASYLQNTAYLYNERGWLSQINDPSVTPTATKMFAEKLNYNVPVYGATAEFNGNIAETDYNAAVSGRQHVVYVYDPLNRLNSGTSSAGYTEAGISYDNMGNILALKRGTNASTAYSYTGNQLTSLAGYINGTNAYDNNGNLKTDGTRGATIAYNMLNLPQTVSTSAFNITYTYDAEGTKLRKVSSTQGTTDYISGIQYKTNSTVIDFVQTDEGRAINTGSSWNYEYTLTDHLGNNRVTFDMVNGKTSEDDYYPFGLNAPRLANSTNLYLYNKKELQNELNEYDYGARFYDPVIARWTVVDPLADMSQNSSPYVFCVDNPILVIDKLGLDTGKLLPVVTITASRVVRTYEHYLMWTTGMGYSKYVVGKTLDFLHAPNNSSNLFEMLMHSNFHRTQTNLSGDLLDKLKKDPAMAQFKKKLMAILKANPQLKKLHFVDGVEFGGKWEKGNELNVTFNELTWAVRHADVVADAVMKTDGTVVINYSMSDTLDLTPQENRSNNYNIISGVLGIVYHGLGGASIDMQTQANWSETVDNN